MKRWLFIALLIHSFGVLVYRWDWPMVGLHGFRETQTAMTAYWFGPMFDYQTPLMGPPWTIPFELPLMQWVTWLVWHLGVPLDAAGRVVSWSFGMLVLLPLGRISAKLTIDSYAACILYMASPIYLFWTTSFLIDSTALFLAMMFLMYAMEERWPAMMLFGVLAALVKLPTLVPFAFCAVSFGLTGPITARPATRSAPC